MAHTIEDVLGSLECRSGVGRWGIGTAAQYVKSIHDESPASDVAKIGDETKWKSELADAAGRLTYCDDDMGIKSFSDGTGITNGAVLEYDCVLSSRRMDRDGDILEPKGMNIDKSMPLLWQHLQLQPIGKHVKVLSQDDSLLQCKFAIADIALGRDAATLVKFGALRKSHGFKPIPGEFEPVDFVKNAQGAVVYNDKGQPLVKGWHVKKSNVYEGSLVSIPANADGNVLRLYEKQFDGLATAFSRDLLEDSLVKHWAKSIYDKRPVTVPGIDLVVKSGGRDFTWNPLANRWQDVETKRFISARTLTENDQMATKAASMKCPHCGTANDLSGVPDGMDLSKQMCSSCGKPLGTKKDAGELDTKAGRTISAANEKRVREAIEALSALLDDAGLNDTDMERAAKKIASGLTGDVVLSGGGKSLDELATKTLGGLSIKSAWDDSYGDELPGSYEAISSNLSRQVMAYLKTAGTLDIDANGYCRTLATFPAEAIVCCRTPGGGGEYKTRCFRIAYTVDADGKAKFSGTPTEVEVKPVVMEKALAALSTKQFDATFAAPVPTTPPDAETLTTLSRKMAAKIITADGTGGEVELAFATVSKAHATLKQLREAGELAKLFE